MAENVTVRYGGKNGVAWQLQTSDRFVCVRTRDRAALPVASLGSAQRRALEGVRTIARYEAPGVEILDVGVPDTTRRDVVRGALKGSRQVDFAGRALVAAEGGDRVPIAYTENVFVKFAPEAKDSEIARTLSRAGLQVKRSLGWTEKAFFASAPKGSGLDVFAKADEVLAAQAVEFCHPELIAPRARKRAFAPQWHLRPTKVDGIPVDAHANVRAAWPLSTGAETRIAIIDDGVDVTHPEFADRVAHARDVTRGLASAMPFSSRDNHGTACAGVACAQGRHGASGVAPDARLIPIRLDSGLGSIEEAEAFAWAVAKGADVISCSWGPTDGRWWEPSDPLHRMRVPLPDSTRTVLDYAATKGRRGKGCVIFFAAGNGNESVDLDGYASYEKVLAVAACNDRSVRSVYSDFGKAVFCCFPSSDFEDAASGRPAPLTPGIWTTDRVGTKGYNGSGDYTDDFGGTSSACPGAAGVAALVLAANPKLTRAEVRDVLKETAVKIDPAGGAYDARGHSKLYGYGRLDAAAAVRAAVARKTTALPHKSSLAPKKAAARSTKKGRTAAPK